MNQDIINEENNRNPEEPERVLLVGVDTGEDDNFESSMEELGNLAQACGMQSVGVMTQKLETINKGLYIGTGKVQEVKEAAGVLEAEVIIFDNTLTPSQLRNLQEEIGRPVMDRTNLILDIFETRAQTREAKLQVETARLQYLLPRLVGLHEALTRQGGASGSKSSKGAGEKKLELDRRKIEHRISELRKELEEMSSEREVQRKRRVNSRTPQVSLVGYTNAGKSTILNGMVDLYMQDESKKVLEKDMLFATLETTVRRIEPGNNQDFLLADTVGFIHKLPHGLVKAFRSTLEEVKNADLLLHVVDYSDPHYKEQMKVTEETLQELGAGDIPVIYVFNKADRVTQEQPQVRGEDRIYMSARQKDGLQRLVKMILDRIYSDYQEVTLLIPYTEGQLSSYFMENATVLSSEYAAEGNRMRVRCHGADARKYAAYLEG